MGVGDDMLTCGPASAERAEIIREKGTNRSQFFRGQLDKYTWVDVGSSYLPSELIAALLWAQMQKSVEITARRLSIWNRYHEAFEEFETSGRLRRPCIADRCAHNAHMYYLLLETIDDRTRFIARLKEREINAVFHYVPLHASSAGGRFGRVSGSLRQTESLSDRLVRLPLWLGLEQGQERVIEAVIWALC